MGRSQNRNPRVLLAILTVCSLACVAIGLAMQPLLGVIVHDFAFDAVEALNHEQQMQLWRAVRAVTGFLVSALVVTNVAWTIGMWSLDLRLALFARRSGDPVVQKET